MDISITGLGLSSTNLENFTKEKFNKISQHFPSINKSKINVSKDNKQFTVTAILFERGKTATFKTDDPDAYSAVNKLTKKIHTAQEKIKKKQKNKRRNALLPDDVSDIELEELQEAI